MSRKLRAAGKTKELGVTLQRARLLILSLEDQHQLTESGPLQWRWKRGGRGGGGGGGGGGGIIRSVKMFRIL